MHYAYWGLERPPFSNRGSAGAPFHEGEVQSEALARLRYLAAQKCRAGLVVGGRGCGKTLLIQRVADERRAGGADAAVVNADGLSARDALWTIASQLSANPRPDDDASKLMHRMANWADAARLRHAQAVVLVDDVDRAGPDVLRPLLRLARSSEHSQPWLTIVFACRDASNLCLGDALLDAVDLRVDLDPWEEMDTIAYVQMALFEAGCQRPIFQEHALSVLHMLSGGVPRDVNRLGDYALLGGASGGCETIDAGVVEAAYDALHPTAMV